MKNAKNGLVFGIVSLIAWILPIAGYPVSILGIYYSSKGIKSELKTKAIIGLVLSVIGLFLTLGNSFLGVLLQLK
jgi:hypothetical protein